MSILDAVIIVFIIVGIMGGFRRGLIKEVVYLVGMLICMILAFSFKNVLSAVMYKYLPFFNFGGFFKGISAINILLYEVLSFLVIFSVLYLLLRLLLKISGLIEKLLKATIILGFFSKIGGAIVGFIESYILIFVFLFLASQPFLKIRGFEDSRFANKILDNTPIMSKSVENTRGAIDEIYLVVKDYKESNAKEYNKKTVNLLIKYEIISKDNADYLREKGKID